MNIVRLKRPKIGTVLSTITPLFPDVEGQKAAVEGWSKLVPKVMIIGEIEPPKGDGIRHVKAKATINNILGTYAQSIPGLEGVCLTNPNVELDENGVHELAKYIESERMELTWGCRAGKTFFMSSQVAAHLVNDLPFATPFNSDWQSWVDSWMARLLRQRYLDVTRYNLVRSLSPDKEGKSLPTPKPTPRKKTTVRKVKLA